MCWQHNYEIESQKFIKDVSKGSRRRLICRHTRILGFKIKIFFEKGEDFYGILENFAMKWTSDFLGTVAGFRSEFNAEKTLNPPLSYQ